METDAREVRPGEQLDWARLAAWLRERLPACQIPGLDVSREPRGRAVSRRPLEPDLSRRASATRTSSSGVRRSGRCRRPRTTWRASSAGCRRCTASSRSRRGRICCARTSSVIGSVFYAMERRRGLVVRAEEPPALADPEARRRLSEALVDTLADLHAIDVRAPAA